MNKLQKLVNNLSLYGRMRVKCLLNKKQKEFNKSYCNAVDKDVGKAVGHCGGAKALAQRLGVSEGLIRKVMFGHSKLSDNLKNKINTIYH